jgi:tetratricopeptide (TPR) repeat protein
MWQNRVDRVVYLFRAWPKTCASLGLACLIACVYANSLDNGFVLDDLFVVSDNPHIRKPIHEWPGFFSLEPGRQVYRPLRTLSYAIDYQLGGSQPFFYHVSNILYHWLAACLLFAVSRRLLSPSAFGASTGVLSAHPEWRDWIAFGTALVWALHPIQTDSVTYISGRRDILAGLFFFIGIYAFLRLRTLERPSRPARWGWAAAALGAFFVGALAKEVVFIFPAVFFAYDWCREYAADKSLWQNVRHTSLMHRWLYVPVVLVGNLGGLYYYPYLSSISGWHGGGPLATWSTVPRIWLHYVQLLVWPSTLVADYWGAFPISPNFWNVRALFALLLISILLSGVVWAVRHEQRLVAFSGAWFFLTLLPMSHIIPHKEMVAEHYLYIPSVGFGFLVCLGLAQLAHRWRQTLGIGLGLVVLLAYTARTVVRNQDWQDELTLWQKTLQTGLSSVRVHHNLAVALHLRENQLEAAEESYQRAIALSPEYAASHTGLAELYLDLRRYDEALIAAKKGRELGPHRVWSYWILGRVYYQHGHFDKALTQFVQVAKMDPDFQPAYGYVIQLYQLKGEYEKARQWERRMPAPPPPDSLPPGFRKRREED